MMQRRVSQLVIIGDLGEGRLDRNVRIWLGVLDGLRRQHESRTLAAELRLGPRLSEMCAAAECRCGSVWSMHACAN